MAAADQEPLSEERVTEFLKEKRNFLEDHVMKHVDAETLERWLIRRTQRDTKAKIGFRLEELGRKVSLSRWKVNSDLAILSAVV